MLSASVDLCLAIPQRLHLNQLKIYVFINNHEINIIIPL